MKRTIRHGVWVAALAAGCVMAGGCTQNGTAGKAQSADTRAGHVQNGRTIDPKAFDADSAYRNIEAQVNFGPRVSGTPAAEACGAWLEGRLKALCDTVYRQEEEVVLCNGKRVMARNYVGVFDPERKNRVLLVAHWDSRPWSDQDVPEHYDTPVPGADDGASGVGVLLEVARIVKAQRPRVGVDILLVDAEDAGDPRGGDENSWCLGTQAWAKHPHVKGYRARYGILLDMVGGGSAVFSKEGLSMRYAPQVVEKIWRVGHELGHGAYFANETYGSVTDDHKVINEQTGIPTADVIAFGRYGFPSHWHTQNDNMSVIGKETLRAVGETVLGVLGDE